MKTLLIGFLAACELAAAAPALPAGLLGELRKPWPGNRTVNLVFHGHSVPAGYHKTPEVKPFDSYPLIALGLIKEAHPHAVVNAIVTAIGGENSVAGAARFKAEVLVLRPDVIFIDYALNDRRLPVDQVEEAWREMAAAAKARGIPVVFVTPTGAEDVRIGAGDEPLELRAALIRRVAADLDVPVADAWAAWKTALAAGTDQKALLSQINHPNRAGHELVAREIARLFGME